LPGSPSATASRRVQGVKNASDHGASQVGRNVGEDRPRKRLRRRDSTIPPRLRRLLRPACPKPPGTAGRTARPPPPRSPAGCVRINVRLGRGAPCPLLREWFGPPSAARRILVAMSRIARLLAGVGPKRCGTEDRRRRARALFTPSTHGRPYVCDNPRCESQSLEPADAEWWVDHATAARTLEVALKWSFWPNRSSTTAVAAV